MRNQSIVNSRAISLGERLRVRVSHPEHLRRIAIIDREDFNPVSRLVRKELAERGRSVSDAYLARGVYALKQYYAVAMLDPANAHAVSVAVDPFWHAHILHTERYVPFCNAVVGEYMHHRPLDHGNKRHVDAVRSLYAYTLEVLPKLFTHTEDEFWQEARNDTDLICMHKGNQEIYALLQPIRLFEPDPRGVGYDMECLSIA